MECHRVLCWGQCFSSVTLMICLIWLLPLYTCMRTMPKLLWTVFLMSLTRQVSSLTWTHWQSGQGNGSWLYMWTSVKWCILAEETETVHTQWWVTLARYTHLNRQRKRKTWGSGLVRSLRFSARVARATNKAYVILVLIRRSFTYRDPMSMKQLYITVVRPHLEYGNVVWHPYLKQDIQL